MQMEQLAYALVVVLVLIVFIVRQFKAQPIVLRRLAVLPVAFIVIGLMTTKDLFPNASVADLSVFCIEAAALTALGVARGAATKVSVRNGFAYQQGGALGLVLWLVTIAVRLSGYVFAGALGATGPIAGAATIMLTLGLSFGAQNLMVWRKASLLNVPFATRDEKRAMIRS